MPSTRFLGVPCWIFPVCAGVIWLATLLYLLISWSVQGSTRYPEMFARQEWPYISNTGATKWGQPVFIAGSAIMVLLLCATNGIERWLRHRGRLVHHDSIWTRAAYFSSVSFTIVGSMALVLLTIFNVRDYSNIHYPLVAVFLFGFLLSALSTTLERLLISRAQPLDKRLQFSFRLRLVLLATQIALVCAFAGTMYQRMWGPSVVLEWVVGVLWAVYMCACSVDFWITPRRRKMTRGIIRHWDCENAMPRLPVALGDVVPAPRPTRVRFGGREYIELP